MRAGLSTLGGWGLCLCGGGRAYGALGRADPGLPLAQPAAKPRLVGAGRATRPAAGRTLPALPGEEPALAPRAGYRVLVTLLRAAASLLPPGAGAGAATEHRPTQPHLLPRRLAG